MGVGKNIIPRLGVDDKKVDVCFVGKLVIGVIWTNKVLICDILAYMFTLN